MFFRITHEVDTEPLLSSHAKSYLIWTGELMTESHVFDSEPAFSLSLTRLLIVFTFLHCHRRKRKRNLRTRRRRKRTRIRRRCVYILCTLCHG